MRALDVSELQTAAADGGDLPYYCHGQGPPILFINGLGGSFQAFEAQLDHFGPRYRCLGWDYRGVFRDRRTAFGQLPSVADHASDASTLLLAEGVTRTAIIAWSHGVQVALELYRHMPDRVAILVFVAGGAGPGWMRSQGAGVFRRRLPALVGLVERWEALLARAASGLSSSPEAFTWARRVGLIGPGLDAETFARLVGELARLDPPTALATLRAQGDPTLLDVPSTIDVPTLVIAGDRDPFTSRAASERLVHQIPGAEYLVLPGAGHYLLLDRASHVNLRIDKFFAERGYAPG